jgi:Fur family peroxide stress response transcriptional regulator
MTTTQGRFEELIDRLRQRNYRLTPQRVALLRLLAESERHPSAAHLYEQIREVSHNQSGDCLQDVNRPERVGEVLELGFSDDDNRYDGNKPYPHPHLVCIRCRRIVDPEVGLVQIAQPSR